MKTTSALCLVLALLLIVLSGIGGALLGRQQAAAQFVPPQDTPSAPDSDSAGEDTTPTGQEGETEPAQARVSFLAAGDIVLHESVFLDANLRAGESGVSGSVNENSAYDFLPMFARVSEAISSADISLVNQETLIGAAANGIPTGYEVGFNGPTAAGDALVELGFDVVNIGNNHMLDRQSAGLRRSMEYWRTKPSVTLLGAYDSEADCDNLRILTKNGIRIAFLSYLGNTPGTNGYQADASLYIPYLNEQLVLRQMKAAREQADCVIVTVHWGNEGTFTLNREQTSYGEMFASLGADALIGTHPHVIQPMQWVERSGYAGGGRMLLCNSLGDFLSHTQLAGGKNKNGNLLGGYVTFEIVKTEAGVVLENTEFVPTVSHYDENSPLDTGFVIYPLVEYTDSLLARFGDPKAGFTSRAQLVSIVTRNIPSEFLAEELR